MPFSEITAVDERCRFVTTYLSDVVSMSDLCAEYRISRPTGYKWVERYRQYGPAGLYDRSRAPHDCPHRMDDEVAQWMLQDRRQHPTWGARKIVRRFKTRFPKQHAPSPSAVAELFNREGLSRPAKRTRRPHRAGGQHPNAINPHDLWTIDFKGQFRTGDRHYCYPLTIMDCASRYLLACRGALNTCGHWVIPFMDRLFKEHGLPHSIHSDNGAPFCSFNSIAGLSRLSVHWLKLGITIERSRPGCPQDNPIHERMHRTLKADTARPPATNLRTQQTRFDHFTHEYNRERPHEGIEERIPAQLYRSSPRPYPARLPEPEYPGHFEQRRIASNGCLKLKGNVLFIGAVFSGEELGLEEVDDGIWHIHFYHHLLARLDERNWKIIEVPL
jgi:putative transposase